MLPGSYVGYLVDFNEAWAYLFGAAYVLFNGRIIWQAWKRTAHEAGWGSRGGLVKTSRAAAGETPPVF